MSDEPLISTVFARVARAETGEDQITEIFATLLTDLAFRRAFIQGVVGLELAPAELAAMRVTTQHENRHAKGYPDVGMEAAARVHILVENKIRAGFTDNQPHEYVLELAGWHARNPAGATCLVIQVPASRCESVAVEAWQRLPGAMRDGPLAGRVQGVDLRIVSWAATAEVFRTVTVADPVLAFIRDNFIMLLDDALGEVATIISEDHITMLSNPKTLEAVAAVEDLVRDLAARFRADEQVNLKVSLDVQGFELDPYGARWAWVGTSYRTGAKLREGPLWLQLGGTDFSDAGFDRLRQAGYRVYDPTEPSWYERPLIPLKLEAGLDPPALVERLYREVTKIQAIALGKRGTKE